MNVAREKITLIDGGKSDDPPRKKGRGSGGGKSDGEEWRDQLILGRSGEAKATAHNILLILERDKELAGLFWLDEFANRVGMLRDPPWAGSARDEFSEMDAAELSAWLGSPRRYSMPARADSVMQMVEAIARRARSHPVRSYLSGLKWDGTPRVERMFPEIFGAEDVSYVHLAAKCFMVSAVARILWVDKVVPHYGAQVDFMLILESPYQGAGKTSAVRELFGPQWYSDALQSPSTIDFFQALRGRWGVEIGEMDTFSKADVTRVKQAITSRFDVYRPSYGRYARSFRRECVFVGTTNESEYLRDVSGGRRFLPVRISEVNINSVREQRDQLWAEAVALFEAGFKYWELPAAAADEQEARFVEDSWQGPVRSWLAGQCAEKDYPPRLAYRAGTCPPIEWTTTTEVLSWALCVDLAKHNVPEQMRVGKIMRRLGWCAKRVRVDGGDRERRWVKDAISNDPIPF